MNSANLKTPDKIEIASQPSVVRNDKGISEATKNLLDVVSSIIADEYIEIAKENSDTFKAKEA